MKKFLSVLATLLCLGCARNVEYIKQQGPQKWKELGYVPIGYEGYQWSLVGGDVWWSLKRKDSPGIIYSGYLTKWGDELMVYGPQVVSGTQINLLDNK